MMVAKKAARLKAAFSPLSRFVEDSSKIVDKSTVLEIVQMLGRGRYTV